MGGMANRLTQASQSPLFGAGAGLLQTGEIGGLLQGMEWASAAKSKAERERRAKQLQEAIAKGMGGQTQAPSGPPIFSPPEIGGRASVGAMPLGATPPMVDPGDQFTNAMQAYQRFGEPDQALDATLALQERADTAANYQAQMREATTTQTLAMEKEERLSQAKIDAATVLHERSEKAAQAANVRRDTRTDKIKNIEYFMSLSEEQRKDPQVAEQLGIEATGGMPDFTEAQKLRKEFLAETKDFRAQTDAMGRVQASASDPSAAGDLALIFNYMKVLDPGSVVRESEFATAENTGSVPNRIWRTYNKVLEGERLSPPMRADFVGRAGKLYGSAVDLYRGRESEYSNLATRLGFDPKQIFIERQVLDIPTSKVGGTTSTGAKWWFED